MRIFKNKAFVRFARKSAISDAMLCQAIRDADRGLIGANLGGGVIKQRIARSGEGKSGGFRTLIVFRTRERAFFVHGFPKNATSARTNWPPSRSSHQYCWPMTAKP
jgi:hypothetical protein